MSIFSSYKKLFLLGFMLVILVTIPFSVYIAQQRQNTVTKAAKASILSFEPATATTKVDDTVTLSIMLEPGTNQVSFVKLTMLYDSTKFTTLSDSIRIADSPNTLTTIIEEAKYEPGKASIALSIGADPTKAVITKTKIATLTLKGSDVVSPTAANISFDSDPNTQVLSIASGDLTSENVLSTTIPATVSVTAGSSQGGPSAPTSAPSPTPTQAAGSSSPAPTKTLTSLPQTGGSTPTTSSTSPVCSSLELSGPAVGTAPYSLSFKAIGNDSDGTISKITFNFGDSIEDLVAFEGINTNFATGQLTHTYQTQGTYSVFATFTDNDNNLSMQNSSCTKTITINSGLAISPTVNPSLPPTGNGTTLIGIGIVGAIFTIIGGALLLL